MSFKYFYDNTLERIYLYKIIKNSYFVILKIKVSELDLPLQYIVPQHNSWVIIYTYIFGYQVVFKIPHNPRDKKITELKSYWIGRIER